MIEGIYEEIISRGLKEKIDLLDKDNYLLGKEKLDVEEAKKFLSVYIGSITRKALEYIREEYSEGSDALYNQIKICNGIIELLKERLDDGDFDLLEIEEEGEILTHVYSKMNNIVSIDSSKITRPITPISESSLFTGSHHEPNMLGELKREIATSDSIDMLVSFIKWSGLRCIYEELKDFTENKGGQLRVITTSYMEATDYKAIEELGKLPNTEIKISYDTTRTRLHAKSYVFKRDTGFSTAYIGSSNLSNPALTSGLEWNIKVTEKDSLDIIKKVDATFESYWNDNEFTSFDLSIGENKDRLKKALTKNKPSDSNNIFTFDIYPYHFQKEILEKLEIERKIFGRYKNLLVAATGVGKTVISAFDYKRFLRENGRPARLLYVVHREEILKQSLNTFRGILKDNNFGDLLVGAHNPDSLDHLFTSIQSFNSIKLYNKTSDDFYDYIIIDAAHDAEAIYELLNHNNVEPIIDLNPRTKNNFSTESDIQISPKGIPICPSGLEMKPNGFDKSQNRHKWRCPHARGTNNTCEKLCSDAKFGRTFHTFSKDNLRLFPKISRASKEWKLIYKRRTSVERSNKREKIDYKLEDGRHRSTKMWYIRLYTIMMCQHIDAWNNHNKVEFSYFKNTILA